MEMSEIVTAGFVGGALVFLRRKWIRWSNKRKPRSSSFRRQLIRKYGKKCMICSSRKKIEAHHIDPKRKGGSDNPEENGILLCHKCHTRADNGEFSQRYLRRRVRKAKI